MGHKGVIEGDPGGEIHTVCVPEYANHIPALTLSASSRAAEIVPPA